MGVVGGVGCGGGGWLVVALRMVVVARNCHGFCYGFLWGMGMGIDFCTPTKPIPQPWVWWVGGGYGGLVVGMVGW
jgi:hypothetical protein